MEHDPAFELVGANLRTLVIAMLETGRVSFPLGHAVPRMEERYITAPQIEAVLRSGALSTSGFERNVFRYCAVARGITVIFTFDIDDDGNLLVVITTWRNR